MDSVTDNFYYFNAFLIVFDNGNQLNKWWCDFAKVNAFFEKNYNTSIAISDLVKWFQNFPELFKIGKLQNENLWEKNSILALVEKDFFVLSVKRVFVQCLQRFIKTAHFSSTNAYKGKYVPPPLYPFL